MNKVLWVAKYLGHLCLIMNFGLFHASLTHFGFKLLIQPNHYNDWNNLHGKFDSNTAGSDSSLFPIKNHLMKIYSWGNFRNKEVISNLFHSFVALKWYFQIKSNQSNLAVYDCGVDVNGEHIGCEQYGEKSKIKASS